MNTRHRPLWLVPGLALTLAGIAGALGACGVLHRQSPPSVILISIDTCRADHLGSYGYPRPTTPQLDRFAKEAVRFTHAVSSVPLTLPSHCSMLTGTTPLQHGVHDNYGYRLAEADLTVAEILRDAGCQTAAIVGSFVLGSRFGLAQGFQLYDDQMDSGRKGPVQSNERPAGEVTRRALEWLATAPKEPFFLFVHYFDPHTPYAPPEPFATQFRDSPYSGEIAYVDAEVGKLFARLRELHLYENSLIIVTGDHGEALGEHGESGHGYFIYQSTLHVPLLIKTPGQSAPRQVDELVGLIDIAPTILGQLGHAAPAAMTGRDLIKSLAAGAPAAGGARDFYCESLTATKYGCAPLLGLMRGSLKYIQTSRPELYDLSGDPAEQTNVIAERPAPAKDLKAALDSLLASAAEGGAKSRDGELSEEVRERLQSLGYVAGRSVAEGFTLDASRIDPKDRIKLHERFDEALALIQARRLTEAEKLCSDMLQTYGAVPVVYILRGDIAHTEGRLDDAELSYRLFLDAAAGKMEGVTAAEVEALRDSPDRARVHYDLALTLAALHRPEEALLHYRQAVEIQPEHLEARLNLACVLVQQRRFDESIAEFQQLLTLAPGYGNAYVNFAQALYAMNRPADAIALLCRAVQALPGFAPARLALGDLYVTTGDLRSARETYTAVVRLHPDLTDGLVKLIWVTRQLGDQKEAQRLTETARRRFPGLALPPG